MEMDIRKACSLKRDSGICSTCAVRKSSREIYLFAPTPNELISCFILTKDFQDIQDDGCFWVSP